MERGRQCVQPVIEARTGSLQIKVGTLNNCFAKLMADERGRRYLLGVGNAALVNWGRQVASDVGKSLADGALGSLGQVVKDASEDLLIRDDVDDLGVLYGSLVRGLRANIKQPEDAAAELSAVLGFLDEEATQPGRDRDQLAEVGERYVREPLGPEVQGSVQRKKANDREKLKADADLLKQDIGNALTDMLAVVLWAEGAVRSRVMEGPFPPGVAPGSSPPTEVDGAPIDPPLETPDHVLHVPDPSDPPGRRSAFFGWLQRGGGLELHGATLGVLRYSGLETKLRGLADELYSGD